MFDFHFKRPSRLALGAAAAAAVLTLAACGSSNDDNNGAGGTPGSGTPPPVVAADSFITIVKALLTVTNETDEPSPIGGVTATAPEDSEPEPTT